MWFGLAIAAPVSLPPTERSTDWEQVLALVDLSPGVVEGEGVLLADLGDRWEIVALADGVRRKATVSEPRDPSAREDVAQLAASLLREARAVGLPPLPPLSAPPQVPPRVRPPSPPPRPPTVPLPAAEPLAAPLPVVVVPAVLPPLDEAVEPLPDRVVDVPTEAQVVVDVPLASPPRWHGAGWGALALSARDDVRPAVVGELWGGVAGGAGRLAGGLFVAGPAALALGEDRSVHEVGAQAGAWLVWAPLELGLVGGGASRVFRGDRVVERIAVPTVGGSVVFARGPLRGELRVTRDLREVQLYVGDVREQIYEPWAVLALAGLRIP